MKKTVNKLLILSILIPLFTSCNFILSTSSSSSNEVVSSSEEVVSSSSSSSESISSKVESSSSSSSVSSSSIIESSSSVTSASIIESSSSSSQSSIVSSSSSITSASSSNLFSSSSNVSSSVVSSSESKVDSSSNNVLPFEVKEIKSRYVRFKLNKACSSLEASYIKEGSSNLIKLDDQLISYNENDNTCRVDLVNIKKNERIKLVLSEPGTSNSIETDYFTYSYFDQSGYAHFNNSDGVGAYNNDGTLKDNAVVLYVNNENKNTIQATLGGKSYTGLVDILKNQSKSSYPLNIRITDKILTNQWKVKDDEPRLTSSVNYDDSTFFSNELEDKYGDNLKGLTIKLYDKKNGKSYSWVTTKDGLGSKKEGTCSKSTTLYKGDIHSTLKNQEVYDDDSYNNMLDVSEAKNVTLEGIGDTSGFFQFGFNFSKCNSIEVRNLSFSDYPEDACSYSGDVTKHGTIWVHNNTFYAGKNNWDLTGERDKPKGDGAFDLASVKNVTLSYNYFNGCKKTGLVGGSDSVKNKNITFHHNFYDSVNSRLPLGRQANMHIYNNYYLNCSTCLDIRANAFVFSENNYFKGCKNPQKVTTTSTYKYTTIKSYGDYFVSSGASQATIVSSRETKLEGKCIPDGTNDYTNFDTNKNLFYYDDLKKESSVEVLNKVEDVPSFVISNAGKY